MGLGGERRHAITRQQKRNGGRRGRVLKGQAAPPWAVGGDVRPPPVGRAPPPVGRLPPVRVPSGGRRWARDRRVATGDLTATHWCPWGPVGGEGRRLTGPGVSVGTARALRAYAPALSGVEAYGVRCRPKRSPEVSSSCLAPVVSQMACPARPRGLGSLLAHGWRVSASGRSWNPAWGCTAPRRALLAWSECCCRLGGVLGAE